MSDKGLCAYCKAETESEICIAAPPGRSMIVAKGENVIFISIMVFCNEKHYRLYSLKNIPGDIVRRVKIIMGLLK